MYRKLTCTFILCLVCLVASATETAAESDFIVFGRYTFGYEPWTIPQISGIDGFVDCHGIVEGVPGGEYVVFLVKFNALMTQYGTIFRVVTDGDPDLPHSESPRTFIPVSSFSMSNWATDANAFCVYIAEDENSPENGIYYGPGYTVGSQTGIWKRPLDGGAPGFVVTATPPANHQTLARDPVTLDWYCGTGTRWIYRCRNGTQLWTQLFRYPYLGGSHHDGMAIVNGSLFLSDMTTDVLIQYRLDDIDDPGFDPLHPNWYTMYTYTDPFGASWVEGMGFGPNAHLWTAGYDSTITEIGGGILQNAFRTDDYIRIDYPDTLCRYSEDTLDFYIKRTCPDPPLIKSVCNAFSLTATEFVTFTIDEIIPGPIANGWWPTGLEFDGIYGSPGCIIWAEGWAPDWLGGLPPTEEVLYFRVVITIGAETGAICIDSTHVLGQCLWQWQDLACGDVCSSERPLFLDKDYSVVREPICIPVEHCPDSSEVHIVPPWPTHFNHCQPVTITFQAVPGLCEGLPAEIVAWSVLSGPGSIDNNGNYSAGGLPTGTYPVCIQVENSCGATDECWFDLVLTNSPPCFTNPPLAPISVLVGGGFTYDFYAVDADPCDALIFTLTSYNGPGTITVDPVAGCVVIPMLVGNPGEIYTFGIEVADNQGGAATCYGSIVLTAEPTLPGVSIAQVDFVLDQLVVYNSNWGRIGVDVEQLATATEIPVGYLNGYTDSGWVIQNMIINSEEPTADAAMYFDLGVQPGTDMMAISMYLTYTEDPLAQHDDGPRATYGVGDVSFRVGGIGFEPMALLATPPPAIEFNERGETYDIRQTIWDANIQCAVNQCAPCATTNALQYLENRHGVNVPHDHVLGLKGDNSLVGQHDTYMNRWAPSRLMGWGLWFVPWVQGKFQYLANNGLATQLTHHHQGYGWGGAGNQLPAGDFTYAGITSVDETDPVLGIDFDWICDCFQNGEGIELAVRWGMDGGHAVRVNGCGRTLGQPWVMLLHDRNQTDDSKGLESVQCNITRSGGSLMVDFCGRNEVYCVVSSAVAAAPLVKIEKTHNTHQGHYEFVSITLEDNPVEFGGFDFLVAYDASALTFMEATPGQLLEDCGWEYFTYRYGWQGNCEGPCPSGLLRIVAIAETNNGPNHPSCFGPPDSDPHELAEMKFHVTNDRTFNCMYVPIRFFWHDCGDNTLASVTGDTLWLSDHVYDFEGNEVTGSIHYGGHWWLDGPPYPVEVPNDACMNDDPEKPDAIPLVDFVHGGIDIACAESIDVRGDINLNGVENEIADAVLFTNYFLYGIGVFHIAMEGQIAATDINNDGLTLSVGDLVYLIRIITGDALPYAKLAPYAHSATVNLAVNHSVIAVSTDSEADIGGGYFVFEYSGYEIGEPLLINGASDMTLKYNDEDGVLKVLVYSMEKETKIAAGAENIFVIPISGSGSIELTQTELSDYNGNLLTLTKSDAPILPKSYALHQNYPNPFNASTRIIYEMPQTAHVKIDIFNLIGQRVRTLIDREELAGVHTVDWDGLNQSGDDVASGVYLYRLTSDNFTSEKKMVLAK